MKQAALPRKTAEGLKQRRDLTSDSVAIWY